MESLNGNGQRMQDAVTTRHEMNSANVGYDPLGISGKLLLAFTALAILTLCASVIALITFSNIKKSVLKITDHAVPRMGISMQIAATSAEISATAPRIVAADAQAARVEERVRLDQHLGRLDSRITSLSEIGANAETIGALRRVFKEIGRELVHLDGYVESRIQVAKLKSRTVAALGDAHFRFGEALEPVIDDAVFELIISGERVTSEGTARILDLVANGAGLLDHLLMLQAEGNLAAGLIAEVIHVDDAALIEPLKERFISAEAAIDRHRRNLPPTEETRRLGLTIDRLLDIANTKPSLFKRRAAFAAQASQVYPQDEVAWKQAPDVLKSAHDDFLVQITKLIDDAAFDLVLKAETVTGEGRAAISDLIDVGANRVHWALTLRSETNLSMGLLTAAATAPNQSMLQPKEERFNSSASHVRRALRHLSGIPQLARVAELAGKVLDHGLANDSIFALRLRELQYEQAAKASVAKSQELASELGDIVVSLVEAAERTSDSASRSSTESIADGQALLVVFSIASLLCATAVMFLYVRPRVVRPLEDMTIAMSRLADGDTSVDVPCRDRRDEMGRMARAVGVFRDTAIEVQESNLKEIEAARRRLSDAIESISEAFSLYDSQDRLVVANSKYKTLLYPGIAEQIEPGMTFGEIIRRAAERGLVRDAEGRIDDWVDERLARHRKPGESHIQQRADGCWIMVSERRTEDGGTVAVYSDITELKQRERELASKSNALEQLSNQLAKYLAPQVYESIFTGRQEVKLTSRRRKLTVFFSDIAGFTETADRLESEDLTALLNHYLTEMSDIALRHGATIDKYVGDAIVIFFGDPESHGVKEDALQCAHMALEMQRRMTELQAIWHKAGVQKPLQCRMGINTGFCTVGNFGSEDRMDYTIIGGGVNLASRLESAAKPGEILISYETFALVRDTLHCEQRGEISVKGIAYPVATYALIGKRQASEPAQIRIAEDGPSFRLDLDVAKMSIEERQRASSVLQKALETLSQEDR